MHPWNDDPASVRPMLATTGEAPLDSAALAYEPKYDGIRALVSVDPSAPAPVRLWSRQGNEKTRQFPEIVEAIAAWAARLDRPVLLDGEIVALDAAGKPVGFQNLQGRIHLRLPAGAAANTNLAFIAFDLLRHGGEDLRPLPLRERRARLEPLVGARRDARFRLGEHVCGDGRALHRTAQEEAWEGLLAKRLDAPYKSGRRSPDWVKLKLSRRQTCVIGGWTAPRSSRPFLGALLLGVYDADGRLQYVGHTGAGFTDAELGRVWRRLQAIKVKACPFASLPKTNERPTWVRPELVAEVKFTEWTAAGRLRQPTYLGLRDDVPPRSVHREPDTTLPAARSEPRAPVGIRPRRRAVVDRAAERAARARSGNDRTDRGRNTGLSRGAVQKLLDQIDEIEAGKGDGVLALPGGERLEVSNLRKVFWPQERPGHRSDTRSDKQGALTKGDLFRHYVRVAPVILPVLDDRPLVMKRYPNGVTAKPFYQHRAPDKLPPGVQVALADSGSERRPHLVGGELKTLLYTAQLASISQDPWFSRVGSEEYVDHVAIDLDPPDDLPFRVVLDVARHVRDELARLKAPAFAKTSGSAGLHVYIPMPPETPYEAGLLFCQIVATMVTRKHPKIATVERTVRARGRRVYVDCLQNIRSKTLASAYSARANVFGGVSTPLTWDEVDAGVAPPDFTIRTFAARLESAGDLWAGLRSSKGADLRAAMAAARK